MEQSSSRSAPIPDIYYFQNALEVASVQLILSFSLTVSLTILYRALEAACAAYASLNLSLLHYGTLHYIAFVGLYWCSAFLSRVSKRKIAVAILFYHFCQFVHPMLVLC